MNRRTLLLTPLVLLAACEHGKIGVSVSIPDNLSELINDAESIYNKLSTLVPSNNFLVKLRNVVSSIAKSPTLAAAKDYVSEFSSLVEALKPHLPTTGTVTTIVHAIDTILPIMLKVAGLVAMFAAGRPTGMTVEQARAILRG